MSGRENGGVLANSAVPARAIRRIHMIRTTTAAKRPTIGPGRARDVEPARVHLWPLRQYEAPTSDEPRHRPTRPETRPDQRVYVPLGSPPLIAVGSSPTRATHRSRAPQNVDPSMTANAARVKTPPRRGNGRWFPTSHTDVQRHTRKSIVGCSPIYSSPTAEAPMKASCATGPDRLRMA